MLDMAQVITLASLVIANVGTVLLLYFHSDKRMDEIFLNTDRKIDQNRQDSDRKIEESRKETNAILLAIHQEMKDFHGRMCAIEERNKKT